jgi:hypothetical protein
MLFSKKCTHCRNKIGKGKGLREKVEIYGLIGRHGRDFCSERCLEGYKKRTAALMSTRRPNLCMRC